MTPNREHPDFDWCIGSSELGGCLKAQAAAKLGYTPLPASERMQELYDRGHEHEGACLSAFWLEGWTVVGRQDEYVIDCGDRVGVIIHVDGIGQRADALHRSVVEIKSPSTWESFAKAVRTNNYSDPYMHKIAWQVSCQMVATGLEAVLASWSEEHGLRTFGVEVPPYTVDDIRARVGDLRAIVESGVLPIECSQADYPCPFVYLHEDAPPDSDPQMDSLVLAYAEAADAEKAAKARKESIRAEVEALLVGETYHSSVGKVTKFVSTRRTIDQMLLKAADIDPEPYMKETLVQNLKITRSVEGLEAAGAADEPDTRDDNGNQIPRAGFEL